MTLAEKYPMGTEIVFGDQGIVRSADYEPTVCTGIVNGKVIVHPVDENLVYVPVWAERDGGREPTTVYVKSSNIIGIRHG